MKRWLAMMLLAACGSDPAPASDTSVGETDVSADTNVGTLVFRADDATAEAVVLREVSLSADELVLDVGLSGLADGDLVYAVGARLTYDPDVLSFVSAEPDALWSSGVNAASGATPGVVVLGVSHGEAFYAEPAAPMGNVGLYRLRFAITARAATTLSLVPERSRALIWPADPEKALNLGWIGGALVIE